MIKGKRKRATHLKSSLQVANEKTDDTRSVDWTLTFIEKKNSIKSGPEMNLETKSRHDGTESYSNSYNFLVQHTDGSNDRVSLVSQELYPSHRSSHLGKMGQTHGEQHLISQLSMLLGAGIFTMIDWRRRRAYSMLSLSGEMFALILNQTLW